MSNIMARHAVETLSEGQQRISRRFALLAATLGACSSLGMAQLRAVLAAPKGSALPPAGEAFFAHLKLCGGNRTCLKRALRMYVDDECECLGPAPPSADIAAEVLGPGALFVMLKEGGALKFAAGDLAGARCAYGAAQGIMLRAWDRILKLPQERRALCALEFGKVNANMSLIELRSGNAKAALNHAADAITAAPGWFKAHARRGAAFAALRYHTEASAAYAIAAQLTAMPRDAADCRRHEDAQLQLARDAEALKDIEAQLRRQKLRPPPGSGAAGGGGGAADGAAARSAAAAAAAAAATDLASIGPVFRALESTTQDAVAALAGYLRPQDLAHLERTCRFFGAAPPRRRVRARRAVRCQPARSLQGRSAAAAATAAIAGVDVAVCRYCDAATDADACTALEALATALAALARTRSRTVAQERVVAEALKSVACADAPAAERCAFWRACAGEAALQPTLLLACDDACALKHLLHEPTAAPEVRSRCMRELAQVVSDMQDDFTAAGEAGTLGEQPLSGSESLLQELVRADVIGEIMAALQWARSTRYNAADAAVASAASRLGNAATQTLYTLLHTYGGARFLDNVLGGVVGWHVRDFWALHAALPPHLLAARPPSAYSAQHQSRIVARLPPDATDGAICAHFVYGADAAEIRAALDADPRALRAWQVTLRPVGAWLARNKRGYLAALAALGILTAERDTRPQGVVANAQMFSAYLLLRGEEWGSGARAEAALVRAIGSVEGLTELFAGFYAMVRNYSYALPQLDVWTERFLQEP
eukprot:TRINITY_DN1735_c1_g1_i1.p1 TRINITY_DN1735_c1_g1~~TRINITY_DN1735_c1_g1_i1.p1  ORF type:complete len:773 (-),score=304.80 TRINITY_DN1735_c1_g1_i1:215-2533(-)